MKRKFLSICLCLMICLTSMLVLSACGEEKPVAVSEVEAAQELDRAMQTLAESESIKISMTMPMNMGGMVVISTENLAYIEMNINFTEGGVSSEYSLQTWSKAENDAFTNYVVMSETEGGETQRVATKSIVLEESNILESDALKDLEDLNFTNFVEATKLKGELTIVFSVDNSYGKITYSVKIVDGKLVSITIVDTVTMTMYISYGDFSSEIPAISEESATLTWNLISEIVVENMPTNFEVGVDSINLEGVVLKFFEDKSYPYDYEEFDITMNMIQGFDTTTATEEGQPRTMTVTFCGLTYDIEYTVTESATN